MEKMGVNTSILQSTLKDDFAYNIPGTDKNNNIWASGISLVSHPMNPFVPPIHMNTRFIVTSSKAWFGGCIDLNPIYPNDEETNFFLYGLLDDVWINTKTDQLIVVDYKATSKDGEVSLDAPWQISYKRQVEIYQWLLRKNGFDVQETAYFVYCNAIKKNILFDNKLHFKTKLIGYKGDDSWIEGTIKKMKSCLDSDNTPDSNKNCEHCRYVLKANL